MRVGFGVDAHAFGGEGPLVLGGVEVEAGRGLTGTSDADVVLHAIADALLGAAALGDLGEWFPSSDPRWLDAPSGDLVETVLDRVHTEGWQVSNCDVTVVAQSVRIAPHRARMRGCIAALLGVPFDAVSVKATTTDGMGAIGRDEGIAAFAAVSLSAREG